MKTTIHSIRQLALAGAAILLLAAAPGRAHAAFVLTLTQSGGNVVVNGSGTLNTTALNPDGSGPYEAFIAPSNAGLYAGPTSSTVFSFYSGLTGPTSFGTGGSTFASSGSGSFVGIYRPSTDLIVPSGYTSGTALTDSDTYTGQTFATLGFTPGMYTYTWGTGVNADSLTITSVAPEPSTWALLGLGGAGLFRLTLRRRAVRA